MNFKTFSIISLALVLVIVVLGGSYYYLFEYSKPKKYLITNTEISDNNFQNKYEVKSYEEPKPTQSYTNTNETSQNTLTQNENLENEANKGLENEALEQINENNSSTEISNLVPNEEPKTEVLEENSKESLKLTESKKEEKIQELKKEITKQQRILEQEKALKKEFNSKKVSDKFNSKEFSSIKEYLSLGKNSRLEPKLSSENVKVYVMDGKFLSDYRIKLLQDLLSIIKENSKDYYLSIFVKMLPNKEMALKIYNKEIIFSDRKKAYKYIGVQKIAPYLNNPQELNSHISREEILERMKFNIKKDGKGSDFAKHIKALRAGLNIAQYFFPFSEIVEIETIK